MKVRFESIGRLVQSPSLLYARHGCAITGESPCNHGDRGGLVAGSGNSNTRYVSRIISGRLSLTGYIIYTKVGYTLSAMGVSIY